MIGGRRYNGDGYIDRYVIRRQHDVYYQALNIIANTCQEYFRLAHSLIADPSRGWESIDSFDHRTLQGAHDILAAVWRFRHENEVRQMELPVVQMCREFLVCPYRTPRGDLNVNGLWGAWRCDIPGCPRGPREEEPDFAGQWLKWLQEEVRTWRYSSHLIRLVMEILTNQNQPVGYRAETALRSDLIARYSDVPWNHI